MESSPARGGCPGAVTLLALIFVTLRLTGDISWSWWWVLSPLWIYACLLALLAVAVLIMVYCERRARSKSAKEAYQMFTKR